MKNFFTILFGSVIFILVGLYGIVLLIISNSINMKYPEPTNFHCYGFYVDSTYVRTSDRNPFESPNRSNKDTLTLEAISGKYLKFNNGESFSLHSDELDLYIWEKL